MIIGTGTDAVCIPRVKRMKDKFGDRFLDRVFTSSEIEYCGKHENPTQHLAARFAAKEATAKALGIGFGRALDWKDIVVCHNGKGKPFVRFKNGIAEKIEKNGYKCHISMAHCTDYATAISILEY